MVCQCGAHLGLTLHRLELLQRRSNARTLTLRRSNPAAPHSHHAVRAVHDRATLSPRRFPSLQDLRAPNDDRTCAAVTSGWEESKAPSRTHSAQPRAAPERRRAHNERHGVDEPCRRGAPDGCGGREARVRQAVSFFEVLGCPRFFALISAERVNTFSYQRDYWPSNTRFCSKIFSLFRRSSCRCRSISKLPRRCPQAHTCVPPEGGPASGCGLFVSCPRDSAPSASRP
jgi:hypothetical protein